MLPMSNTEIAPGSVETQQLRVIAPAGVCLDLLSHLPSVNAHPHSAQANVRLRLRLAFTLDGRAIQDQVDFSGFPAGLTGTAPS